MLEYLAYKKEDNVTTLLGIVNKTLFKHTSTNDLIEEMKYRSNEDMFNMYRRHEYAEVIEFMNETTDVDVTNLVKIVNGEGTICFTNHNDFIIFNKNLVESYDVGEESIVITYNAWDRYTPEIEDITIKNVEQLTFNLGDSILHIPLKEEWKRLD